MLEDTRRLYISKAHPTGMQAVRKAKGRQAARQPGTAGVAAKSG